MSVNHTRNQTRIYRKSFPTLPHKKSMSLLLQDHRAGAFEVALHQGASVTELWSKMLTGKRPGLPYILSYTMCACSASKCYS